MTHIIQLITWIIIAVVVFLLKNIKNSSSSYFSEKAKNLATKQDVKKITRLTEKVQDEFKKDLLVFSKNVDYIHRQYEEQYQKLYSQLFLIVCRSEAIRYVELEMNKQEDLSFNTIPLISTDTIKNEASKNPMAEITNLVNQCHQYASPDLLYLCCIYSELDSNERHFKNEDELSKSVLEITKKIVEKILIDFNQLRHELKLNGSVTIDYGPESAFFVVEENNRKDDSKTKRGRLGDFL